MTRLNTIPNEDETQMIHALIPLWDMCNHEEGKVIIFIIISLSIVFLN